jgi:hypothetical protein
MKTSSFVLSFTILAALFAGGIRPVVGQENSPWTSKQLKDPGALAKAIQDPKAAKPVILNIGPVEQIKGAIRIGPLVVPENLATLKRELAKVPKDKEVVIYCGCCPFDRCPNIRPAFALLKELKIQNPRLLNLPVNIKQDWIGKGYPME